MVRFARLIAAAMIVATTALAGCASSASISSAYKSLAPGGDSRLVGTWKATASKEGSQTTRADDLTYEYLVFDLHGTFTRHGEMTEKATWTATGGDLMLRYPDGEESGSSMFGSESSARISRAYDELETSEHISYQVSDSELTLSGLSRSYVCTGDCLLHPAGTPSTPPPLTPVQMTFVRVQGPPPPEPPGLPTAPSPSLSRPGQPCSTCTPTTMPTAT